MGSFPSLYGWTSSYGQFPFLFSMAGHLPFESMEAPFHLLILPSPPTQHKRNNYPFAYKNSPSLKYILGLSSAWEELNRTHP